MLISRFPPRVRLALGRIVCTVCALLCLVLAYRAAWVVFQSVGETDVSGIETPRWLRFLPVPFGFFFLGTEFLRLIYSGELFQGNREALD